MEKEIIYNWIGGLKIRVRRGDAGIVGNIYFGLYEFKESAFLIHFLRQEDTFLDIGANLGHYALLASGISKCKTIAVEPIPETFSRLVDNVKLNDLLGLIETHPVGVGETPSGMWFSNNKGTVNHIVSTDSINSTKVEVLTIDSLVKGEEIQLMKIDVEGYEKFALLGATKCLSNRSLKSIIIELNFSSKKYGVDSIEISHLLNKNGFYPFDYDPIERKFLKLEDYNRQQFNTIFIRDLEFVKERILQKERMAAGDLYI